MPKLAGKCLITGHYHKLCCNNFGTESIVNLVCNNVITLSQGVILKPNNVELLIQLARELHT